MELLVSKGANINDRANFGAGGTALWYAEKEGHSDLVEFLESIGAISIGPEL